MPLLKKLILIEWLRFFFGGFLILSMIVSITNLIVGLLRENVTILEVLLNHFFLFPQYIEKILPISALMASLFSVNKLLNRNELAAIFASGFSRKEFIITICYVSLFFSFVQLINAGYARPIGQLLAQKTIDNAGKKFRQLKSDGLKSRSLGAGKTWFRGKDYFFAFSAFDPKEKMLKNVAYYFVSTDQKITKTIEATESKYLYGKSWELKNVIITDNLSGEGFPRTSKAASFMIELDEKPSDFAQIESDINTLTFFGLLRYIQRIERSGINTDEYKVLFYDKFSVAFVTIIFALLGIIGIFNPNRRSSSFGKTVFFVMVFTLVYWLIYSYTIQFGRSSKISPFLACFIVPGLFSAYLASVFYKHRRLT